MSAIYRHLKIIKFSLHIILFFCFSDIQDYIDKDASDKLPENQTDDDKQINEQNTDGAAKNSGGDDTGDNKPVDELLKDEINQCIADIIEINKHISDSNDESSDDVEQPPSKRQKINAAATETTTKQNIPHESLYDAGMRELSRMDHVQKVEVIMGYNKMKEKLTQFLNAFVTNNQVVTEEDINRFFRMLKDKKDDGNDDGGNCDGGGGTKAALL